MKVLQALTERGIEIEIWIRDGELIYVSVMYPNATYEFLDERTVQDVEL